MRQVISLGSFCLSNAMIERAGFEQPTYPFDDLFASVGVVTHALGDCLATFLNYDELIPAGNDHSWVQRHYRDEFGEQMTFAHHDMRLTENRAKFERRRARLLALTEHDNPLFVLIGYADRMGGAWQLGQLRRAVTERFGSSHLLICPFGDPEANAEVRQFSAPHTTMCFLGEPCQTNGMDFELDEHATFMVDAIRDAFEHSNRVEA